MLQYDIHIAKIWLLALGRHVFGARMKIGPQTLAQLRGQLCVFLRVDAAGWNGQGIATHTNILKDMFDYCITRHPRLTTICAI